MEIDWPLDEHLRIGSLTPPDAEALFALVEANRDRLRPWMPWEPTTKSPDDTRAFIEGARASSSDREANGLWVDGVLIGTIGLSVNALANAGTIGYWIGRAYEGRGIVTRAAERFLAYGFAEVGLHRIELYAAAENARSRAVAERLGMRVEGTLRDAERVHDGYHDMIVYAMLEDEWRARRAPIT
jgi:ribosomal-protein-serine acetyltransferase